MLRGCRDRADSARDGSLRHSLERGIPVRPSMLTPLLADFAVRLAFGLAFLLLFLPAQVVPARFFRIHCQVILGLLVLAALDVATASGNGIGAAGWPVISSAIAAYVSSILWGLGLPRVALPMTMALVLGCGAALLLASRAPCDAIIALGTATRLTSGWLMGAAPDGHAPGPLLPDGHGHVDRPVTPNRALPCLGSRGEGDPCRTRVLGLAAGAW